ncbi:hypothetical protein J2Z66_001840 [Paenibacillus eucommiae]|uniref:Uncharacterized protein n=1 Tax=Paenibacillus eucommiae TaxID=1355755 RepID=A0ABS4IRP8_9BACL|nr:hypothetical protein [Paenibacillus eucommiae]
MNGKPLSLKELYDAAPRVEGKNRNIQRLILTELAPGIPVVIVGVKYYTMFRDLAPEGTGCG